MVLAGEMLSSPNSTSTVFFPQLFFIWGRGDCPLSLSVNCENEAGQTASETEPRLPMYSHLIGLTNEQMETRGVSCWQKEKPRAILSRISWYLWFDLFAFETLERKWSSSNRREKKFWLLKLEQSGKCYTCPIKTVTEKVMLITA